MLSILYSVFDRTVDVMQQEEVVYLEEGYLLQLVDIVAYTLK